jgi:hypothetical protein
MPSFNTARLAEAQARAASHRAHLRSRPYGGLWTSSRAAEPFETAGKLAKHGVVGLSGLLGSGELEKLRGLVDRELTLRKRQATSWRCGPLQQPANAAEAAVEAAIEATFDRYFGDVRQRIRRYDLKLSIEEPVVREVLRKLCNALGPLLEQVVTLDARIVELASMISDPGALPQQYHSDTLLPSTCGAPVYTCFIALQDVEPAMGATWVIPGTHTEARHHELRDQGPERSKKRQAASAAAVQMTCKSGDAFLMDSRLWHHGGGNTSDSRRRLFYVTFGVPYCHPKGSTYSILDELAGKLKLRDWVSSSTPPPLASMEKDPCGK